MKEYKVKVHGNDNLAKATVAELVKLGYKVWSPKESYGETQYLVTDDDNDILAVSLMSNFEVEALEEINIYELIELVRLKSEKESTTELTIEEIRTKLGLKGELKIVE